jgi:hypothetical protein
MLGEMDRPAARAHRLVLLQDATVASGTFSNS